MLPLIGRRATWGALNVALLPKARCLSGKASELVQVEHLDDGVAVVRLNNAPVNILNQETLTALTTSFNGLRHNDSVKAVVLSSTQRVFSAGLDIRQMHKPQQAAFQGYIAAVQNVFLELYNHPKPIIASIGGPAPAGGCWLALQADYRIMTNNPKAVIGLNETQLGIIAPFYFREPMIRTIGFRHAERLLQLGALVNSQEALRLGLVDALEAEPEKAAIAAAQVWAAVPAAARRDTKAALRQPIVQQLLADREAETEMFWKQIQQPVVQEAVGRYLASLAKKS